MRTAGAAAGRTFATTPRELSRVLLLLREQRGLARDRRVGRGARARGVGRARAVRGQALLDSVLLRAQRVLPRVGSAMCNNEHPRI